jgi:putative membrane protein
VTPSEPRRLHPLTPFFQLLLLARQFLVPLVLLLFANRGDAGQFFPLIPVLVITLIGVVRWWRFTYAIVDGRFVIDEGVLTRKQRVVPLDRIQQVEVVRRLRHRILGVAALRVDTAGGGREAEVDLSVVSLDEADRLRSLLLREAAARPAGAGAAPTPTAAPIPAAAPPVPPVPSRTLVTLGVGRLAVAGMTGSELAVMLTIVLWLTQFVDDLPSGVVEGAAERTPTAAAPIAVAVGLALLAVVWFTLAAVAAIVKNYGFAMTRSGADLHVQRGLFDQHQGSLPLHRLQAARIQESAVRRPFGLARLVLQSGGGASGGHGLSRIDVPILDRAGVAGLLHELLPADPPPMAALVAAPPAARRRAILRRAVPTLVVAVGFGVAVAEPWTIPLGVLAVVVAAATGEVAYRGLGHAWGDDVLLACRGGLRRETDVVPAARAQSSRLRSTPLQRRSGLATLHVEVAGKGRTPAIVDGDAARLRALQRAVVLASPAAQRDEAEVRHRRATPDGGGATT